MITDDERRELRAWRSRQALAVSVLVLVLLPMLALAVVAIVQSPDTLLRTPLAVLLPAGLLWVWLLGRAPVRWRQAGEDTRKGDVLSVRGEAAVDARRGIGILAPSRYVLRIGARSFRIGEFWASQIIPGRTYVARYAPRSGALLSLVREDCVHERPEPGDIPELTRRERDLLRLIARGFTDKEIARELNLSPSTVRTYNSDLYAKLGISRRTQAVPIAETLRLTPVD